MTLRLVATLATLQASQTLLITAAAPRIATRPSVPRAAVHATFKDDLRAVALASLLLVASPMAAVAKGGGHGGGGGHSSSHSSHSSSRRTLGSYRSVSRSSRRGSSSRRGRSSSHRYGSSSTVSEPASGPPTVVLYPDVATARDKGGYYCPAKMPQPGERVDVNGPGRQRAATVVSSKPASGPVSADGRTLQAIPGFDDDCSVAVRYEDGTTETLWAAEQPASVWEGPATVAAYFGVVAAISALEDDSSGAWESARKRHKERVDALSTLESRDASAAPPSGEWWGASEESDDGDQAVRSSLRFASDGSVSGRGVDGVDGAYRVRDGRWGVLEKRALTDLQQEVTVAWVEEYDEGFKVVVHGTYNARSGRIKARFTSSRGVGGAFELAPKPSIF